MIQKTNSEDLITKLKEDKDYSQILIKITSPSKTFEEAKKIIEDLGILITETQTLSSNNWILIKLNVKDMRDVALKLTEHGFIIEGINALL